MTLGSSIFLLALGAILAFAMNVARVGAFNLNAVGWILMAAGLFGLFLSLFVLGPRARSREIMLVDRRDPMPPGPSVPPQRMPFDGQSF